MSHRDDRERLRETFDEAAELYDRARPCYPRELFDDLAELAGIGRGCRVLEVGTGTGQATLPLAERGCEIVSIEKGAHLAAVAQRKLAAFPNVRIVVAAFEDWPLPEERFDVVLSATAFHWIDPAVRVTKAADALGPGGALAIIETHHVAGETEQFFIDVQACYERWDPATRPGFRLPAPADVEADSEELDASGRFDRVVFRRYEWESTYTTASYLDLLLTYSGHRALEREAREGLLSCIADLIDSRYGGRLTKPYLTQLLVARIRRPAG